LRLYMATASTTKRSTLLKTAFSRSPLVERFLNTAREGNTFEAAGLAGSASAFLVAHLHEQLNQTVVVVAPTEKEVRDFGGDLNEVLGEDKVLSFPAWGIHPYAWLAPPLENISERLETLCRLISGESIVIVTSPEALRQRTLSRNQLEKHYFSLEVGGEYDLTDIALRLVEIGYERLPITEEVGTFSIRGGILDIFPFTSSNPVRCEFFGDFIDSMRYFNVLSQRSVETIHNIAVIPRREVLIEQEELERLIDGMGPQTSEIVRDKCLGGFDYPGLEWVTAVSKGEPTYLFDYLPANSRFYFIGRDLIEARLEAQTRDALNLYEQMTESWSLAPPPERIYLSDQAAIERFDRHPSIDQKELGSTAGGINFGMKEHPSFNGQVSLLRESLDRWLAEQQTVLMLSDNQLQRDRLEELLGEYRDRVRFVVSELHRGFVFPDIHTIVLTDHQVFERHFVRHRRRQIKEGVAISSYNALEIGDYVVHVDRGIGRYRGLREIKIDDRRRECLLIVYAGDDKLYVPLEEFSRVQKYIGKEGAPQLTRLGGSGWEKVKARTKKAIADMAEELLALYAARKAKPGYAFGVDDDWMRQLETSFPFEETPDQLTTISAIKRDMEQAVPMDRLVCGDVGFGKTEVAIRAALKAIAGGKQVAVLVPTTILAQQHWNTFSHRLGRFPVRVEMLSRFKSKKEQKEIISDLEAMKVDIIIGTHRLLQKDLRIPNLGLIIVDEEQRFGVAHKEKLKRLRDVADCITLTATPIPRTLQMSLLGARDMSVINTSPKERQSIVTEICEFDPKIIYEAINFEVSRKGQVYFVHNRVETIESMHHYLTKLLKHIRIAVAHGQMPEHELEEVMLGFLNRDYDVLLTSAIIESGIDIPTVNTIVINRADRFGLAQLYQLRGRVGRSQERAYAYLLVPPVKQLTDTARKRLKAIEQHTELGSGFHLAMKDLEIRGAGNLLGPQQHGFIEEVGFDLYCRLLEEAVAEVKGEKIERDFEVKLEIDCDAYISEEYIEDSRQRVDIYRKISEARTVADLDAVEAELVDRFGQYRMEVRNLLDVMAIKLEAQRCHIGRVRLHKTQLILAYGDGSFPTKKQIENLRVASPHKMEFDASDGFVIKISFPTDGVRPLQEAKKLLPILRYSVT
jgi:transcription-repair coupling factor (superfamily II helicase)